MIRKPSAIFVFLFLTIGSLLKTAMLFAQSTSDTLMYSDYIELVVENHPVMKQLDLIEQRSDAYELKARSVWDPKISSSLDRKVFKDDIYFNNLFVKTELPSPYAVKGIVQYENSQGIFTNPELSVPDAGLFGAGISIPLLRNLMFDERRLMIKEAQIFNSLNDLEIVEKRNKLISKASKVYIEWQRTYSIELLSIQGVELAQERYQIARDIFATGDGPAIDTLEALMDLRDREIFLEESEFERIRAELFLNVFLWDDNGQPLEIRDSAIPERLKTNFYETEFFDNTRSIPERIEGLPQIARFNRELDLLDLDRKILIEDKKPQFDAKWMPLQLGANNPIPNPTLTNNYKLGFDFQINIFNRKAKANLALNKVKMEDQLLKLDQGVVALKNEFDVIRSEANLYETNLIKLKANAQAALRLLDAEKEKFQIGESSIFLLNKREMKLLETQSKYFEYLSKLLKKRVEFLEGNMFW